MVIIGASATLGHPNYNYGAYLLALDATTGNVIWKIQVDQSLLAVITASPAIYNGVIYIGISSGQESVTNPDFRGSLVAIAEATGQILWRTYMVPPSYSGGAIWSSTPAIDLSRNQIYITTGNNYTVPKSVQTCEVAAGNNPAAVLACQDPTNYEDSIVALDLTTGVVKWALRCSSTDAWIGACLTNGNTCSQPKGPDFDFGSGANFFTVNINGVATDLVGAGQKSGVYWALNPANGSVVWKQTVGPGGILGGIEWGTATDQQRIYVAMSNYRRAPYLLQPSGMSWAGGSWAALDAGTGKFLWQVPDPGLDPIRTGAPSLALGPVTVANGVMYCADTAGLMFALDASSGNTLWTFQAAGTVNAAPAIIGGMLFWGSGYHNFPASSPLGTASNRFYSFTLPPPPVVTTTALITSVNPAIVGQSVTLTVNVTPPSATGTVTVFDGLNTLGSGILSGGATSFVTSTLTLGQHTLTATYGGDRNDKGSNSAAVVQVINPLIATTTTALNTSPNPSPAGQNVLLSAVVSPVTAGGTVTFSDGGVTLATVNVTQGSALFSTAFNAGVHALNATYSGDPNDSPSSSALVTQLVNAPTTITLTSSANPAIYGQNVSFTANVVPPSASGTVGFYDGITMLGTTSLAGGQATLKAGLLSSGVRTIRSRYNGDLTDLPSSSVTLGETITAQLANGFQPALNFAGLSMPVAIVIGDVNGDGNRDLVIANSGPGNVAVLLGNGDGTFQAATYVAPGSNATALALGDFNNDGRTDLIVAGQNGTIQVMLGNGDGTFQSALTVSAGNGSSTVHVGDFNSDGNADLAWTNTACGSFGVALGNGDGTFQPAAFYGTGGRPVQSAIGDLNADGVADLASANSDGTVSLLIGKGDGTFASELVLTLASPAQSILTTDCNVDGKSDLVIKSTDNTILVLLGNGDGTFQSALTYTGAIGGGGALTTADFNGDGKTDLAVAGAANASISILLGNGDGTFRMGSSAMANSVPVSIVSGEFNGDGKTDLVVVNTGATSVAVLLGANQTPTATTLVSGLNPSTAGQSVTFTASVIPAAASGTVTFLDGGAVIGSGALVNGTTALSLSTLTGGSHVLTAFYAGDATDAPSTSAPVLQSVTSSTSIALVATPKATVLGQTLTLSASIVPPSATGTVTFYDEAVILGSAPVLNGQALFTTSALTAGSRTLEARYTGDLLDLASESGPLIEPVTNLLADGFQPVLNSANGVAYDSVAAADFNGDGKADLALTSQNGSTLNVLLGNGDATFQTPMSSVVGASPVWVSAGDLNKDGKIDLVVANSADGTISTLLGNGDGSFQTSITTAVGPSPSAIAIADFDGDGTPDLAVSDSTSSSLYVLLGNGDGTFKAATVLAAAPGYSVSVGDLNGDGKPDLALTNSNGNSVRIFIGNGDGTFQSGTSYISGTNPAALAIEDWNGDGRPDLAVTNPSSNSVTILLGNGDGSFQSGVSYSVGAVPGAIKSGDFNGDGYLDVAVANQADNTVSLLLGNGDGTFRTATPYPVGGSPLSLAVSELNSDGRADLVTANTGAAAMSVLLGRATQLNTATALTASANPAVYAQPIILSATLTPTTATGLVTFTDGATKIGTVSVVSGVATLGISNLPAGSHSLAVSYSGDGNDASSNSAVLVEVVNQASTVTALSTSVNPSAYGSALILTATVSPATATGSLTFFDGSAAIGMEAVGGGTASLTASMLSVGTHSLTAVYSGNPNNTTSSSGVLVQTITKANSSVTLVSSANPSLVGQSVTVIATVLPSFATGTIVFKDGNSTLGSSSVNGGVAMYTTSAFTAGTHHLVAVYNGNSNLSPSASPAITQTVTKAATGLSLTSSLNPANYGQTVVLTATISPPTPTGSITFKNGTSPIGSGTLQGGVATFVVNKMAVGSNSLTATYGGDAGDAPSVSAVLIEVIQKDLTTTTLAPSPNPANVGQTVTLSATVSPATATGTVTFKSGSTVIGAVALTGGHASVNVSTLPAGSHSLTASYAGDNLDVSSTSTPVIEVIH